MSSDRDEGVTVFRVTLCILLALLVLVFAGRIGVSVYRLAHPDEVWVYCDDNGSTEGAERWFNGPADKVLTACQVGR